MTATYNQGLGMRSEQVMLAIRGQIRQGALVRGDKLPSERELSETHKVSVTTVRRAISRLATEGWITVKHGSGMTVNGNPDVLVNRSKTISVMFSLNAEILARVQGRALASGYMVNAFPRSEMGWKPDLERSFFEHIRQDRHHGLLAFCTPTPPLNDDLLKQMVSEGMRIIHVEHSRDELPEQNFLLPDYRRAGWLSVEHLINAGYRHLRIARLPTEWPGAKLLQQGFCEAIQHYHGRYVETDHVTNYPNNAGSHPPSTRGARELVRGLPPSTGFLCTSVSIANGIMQYGREAGRSCPGDIGVIGLPYMDFHQPYENIDTVEFEWVTYLLDALDRVMAPEWPVIREWVPPRLVKRGST